MLTPQTMTPQAIIAWRARLNLTQIAAAKALGLSRRQWQNFEAGKWPVPLTVRLAMAALESGIADPDNSGEADTAPHG